MKVKDQSPTVVIVDVSRGAGMKSNNEATRAGGRRQSSETRPAPPRRSMHYDGKPSTASLVLRTAVNSPSLPSLFPLHCAVPFIYCSDRKTRLISGSTFGLN